jgi:hypothetical protein
MLITVLSLIKTHQRVKPRQMMRGKPKDGCHHCRSNKHYKKKIVRVLLDSGSNSNLVFVSKDKPILLPYLKRLVPQS